MSDNHDGQYVVGNRWSASVFETATRLYGSVTGTGVEIDHDEEACMIRWLSWRVGEGWENREQNDYEKAVRELAFAAIDAASERKRKRPLRYAITEPGAVAYEEGGVRYVPSLLEMAQHAISRGRNASQVIVYKAVRATISKTIDIEDFVYGRATSDTSATHASRFVEMFADVLAECQKQIDQAIDAMNAEQRWICLHEDVPRSDVKQAFQEVQ